MSKRREQLRRAADQVESTLDRFIVKYPRTACVTFGLLGVAVGWFIGG